jgi:hypothetical protein
MPAWLTEDRDLSRKLVRVKTSRVAQACMAAGVDRDMGGGFGFGVVMGFADRQDGQSQADGDERGAEQERPGAQPVGCGDVAGGQGGDCDAEVAGGFVQAHGQAAAFWADEVHFHHHGGGPGQALADAQDDVGGDDPAPVRGEDQQQRDGQGDEPAGDQDGFAAVAVREGPGEVVGRGLGQTERQDVGQRGGVLVQVEDLPGEQRQHGAFLAERSADQGVHGHQEQKLGQVLAQAQRDGRRCSVPVAGGRGAGDHRGAFPSRWEMPKGGGPGVSRSRRPVRPVDQFLVAVAAEV